MNIHEIITAWQTNTLPKDLDALAAAQNKVDDYKSKAQLGYDNSVNGLVENMYTAEVICYSAISDGIQGLIDAAIPMHRNL